MEMEIWIFSVKLYTAISLFYEKSTSIRTLAEQQVSYPYRSIAITVFEQTYDLLGCIVKIKVVSWRSAGSPAIRIIMTRKNDVDNGGDDELPC